MSHKFFGENFASIIVTPMSGSIVIQKSIDCHRTHSET